MPELQIRENIKKYCTQSEKLTMSLILRWPRGAPVVFLNGESFYSKLIFSCMHILGASVYENSFSDRTDFIYHLGPKIRQREDAGGSGNNVLKIDLFF